MFREFSTQWKNVFHSVENFFPARPGYSLMCTTVAGGKPLNHVDEAWL